MFYRPWQPIPTVSQIYRTSSSEFRASKPAWRRSQPDPSFALFAAGKYLVFSGLLELEGSYSDTEGEDANSDRNLATFEFSTEVFISLRCPKPFMGQALAFHGGKVYLPFGKSNSTMVTDPLTLELGETSDTAGVFAFEVISVISV